eukprot:1536293-Amphidinium_carterae.1
MSVGRPQTPRRKQSAARAPARMTPCDETKALVNVTAKHGPPGGKSGYHPAITSVSKTHSTISNLCANTG